MWAARGGVNQINMLISGVVWQHRYVNTNNTKH